MKALDTNVLVRFLVRDDEKQAETVYQMLKRAEALNEPLFVPLLVVLETIWVLASVYEIPRKEIVRSINELVLMPILVFEAQPAIINFISDARVSKVDLADLLIASSARFSGCEKVLSFDKRASEFRFFELLT
jgi:predicted nucleic-acid-binding protein